jgi:dihydropyrimidinase
MAITWWGQKVWEDMELSVKAGMTSFKHFMAYKGALMVNDDEMYQSFKRVGDLGGLAMVHAENGDVVAELTAKLIAEGNTGPEAHAYSRPPQVEGEATNRAIMIADMAGVPLYVVHTSCEEAHEAIRRARQQGKRVWGEPLIQHLTLDESEYFNADWDHAARRVMSPPFRNKKHQDSLWAGLQSGSLSVVATDHCAFTTAQKRFGLKSFAQIPNGTGGLEDRMPMLWTHGVATGRLTMNEFVAITSTNIAKILNCYPKKGAVLVGADADLVVWDPKAEKTIAASAQQSAIDYNVFEGQKVVGLPRYTLSRGRVGYEDGKVIGKEGHGQFVAREARPAVNRALSAWKDLTAPRPVARTGVPGSDRFGFGAVSVSVFAVQIVFVDGFGHILVFDGFFIVSGGHVLHSIDRVVQHGGDLVQKTGRGGFNVGRYIVRHGSAPCWGFVRVGQHQIRHGFETGA